MTLGPLDKFPSALSWKGKSVESATLSERTPGLKAGACLSALLSQLGGRPTKRGVDALTSDRLRALKTMDLPPDVDAKLLAKLKKRGRKSSDTTRRWSSG